MSQRKVLEQSELEEEKIHIHECYHIKDLLKYPKDKNKKKVYASDLDNTDQQPELVWENLGSDQWFMKLMRIAFELVPTKDTEALVLAIYHAVQEHITTKPVEKETVDTIKNLQEQNIPVFGITARSKNIIEPTVKQLKNIGIEFDFKPNNEDHFGLTIDGIENAAYFSNGIIFCSGLSKGDCLKAFFEKIQWFPEHVVMIDDKAKHLYAVQKVVHNYGGEFDGLRYGYLDKEVAKFDQDEQLMQNANMKMLDIYHKFPDTVKEAVKKIFVFGPPHLQSHSIFKRVTIEAPTAEEKQIKHGKWF